MSPKHTDFTNILSGQTTNSSNNNSEVVVEFLPYSNINEIPEDIKKQLYDQGLPSAYELSKHPIICGYFDNNRDKPFIASIEPTYTNCPVKNATLKYWTKDGNYCYSPFNNAKKLTFEHLVHFRIGEYFSKKSQITSNGVLNETVDNPFSTDPNILQECAGNITTVKELCCRTNFYKYNRFFEDPIKYFVIGHDSVIDTLILQTTSGTYPKALSKVSNITLNSQTQAYLVSIAKANHTSRKRISYLYESQKAYKEGEKPLMIYKCTSSENTPTCENINNSYILTDSGNYINFGKVIVTKKHNYYQILNYDRVVEGFPTNLSNDTKYLIANPFPPELAIINAEAIKRYKESLQDKTTSLIIHE